MGLTDKAKAVARLQRICDGETFPTIANAEIEDILDECEIAAVRQSETPYNVGDSIVTNPNNGRMYSAIEAGTTAATAPTFTGYKQKRDGTVLWQDDGPAHLDLWDMGAARRKVLLLKATRCARLVDAKEGGVDQKWSQMHSHYAQQAAMHDSEFTL